MNDTNSISIENYNYNHPKGNIGFLSKKVKDIIIPLDNTCYNLITDNIETIILNMFKYKVGYSCIVNNDMELKGIIDHNIRKFILNKNYLSNIENIYTKNPMYKKFGNITVRNNRIFIYIFTVIDKKLKGIIINKF